MNHQSPLKNFCSVVAQVIQTATNASVSSILDSNEAATRAALIDPILRTLGWNVSNPDMVEVEKRIPNGKNGLFADYVLKDINGDAQICVEAKSKGTNLAIFAHDLIKYAVSIKGLKYLFLTDGLTWHFYDCQGPQSWNDIKPLEIFELSSSTANKQIEFCLFMLGKIDIAHYWPAQAPSDPLDEIDKLQLRIESLEKSIKNFQNRKTYSTEIQDLQQTPIADANLKFISLNDIENGIIPTGKPTRLRLPDGTVSNVNTWKSVLLESCKFALAHASNLHLPIPDKAGRKTRLISEEQPSSNVSYLSHEHKGKNVFIYLNYDAANCIANANYILKNLGPATGMVEAAITIS